VFVPYSPVNINQVYAGGGTLNDAWADRFFGGIRDWQRDYAAGNGRPGNWMAPCVIRDHHADFRRLVMEHEPEPVDENATEALLDPEYAQGMIDCDEAYQSLADEVWEEHYLRPIDSYDGRIEPLPEVPSPGGTTPGEWVSRVINQRDFGGVQRPRSTIGQNATRPMQGGH
jgi:hypothetical protein